MELDFVRAGVHMLVEKPISMRPAEEVLRLGEVLRQEAEKRGVIVAVGYMQRFNPAVEAAKRIMQEVRSGHACDWYRLSP